MTEEVCPIWGGGQYTATRTESGQPGWIKYESYRAGGIFLIEENGAINIKNTLLGLDLNQKSAISRQIYIVRTTQQPNQKIDLEFIDKNKEKKISLSEKVKSFKRYIISQNQTIGKKFDKKFFNGDCFSLEGYKIIKHSDEYTNMYDFVLSNCIINRYEIYAIIENLVVDGFLKQFPHTDASNRNENPFEITTKGIESMEREHSDSDTAFVAMWFDKTMDKLFDEIIEPAIRDAWYEPDRVDKRHHNNNITDEIIAGIRQAKFVIADLTCPVTKTETNEGGIVQHRGGVYYEAGFAKGLGKEVIFMCRTDKNLVNPVHFDLQQINRIEWTIDDLSNQENLIKIRKQLSDRIIATIGKGTKEPRKPTE